MTLIVFATIFWVLPVVVGHQLGKPKGRAGWAWGLLLGWIGVIVVACLGPAYNPPPVDPQVARLETEVRIAELRKRQEELARD